MRSSRVRVHTNDMIINEHKSEPGQETQQPESEETVEWAAAHESTGSWLFCEQLKDIFLMAY